MGLLVFPFLFVVSLIRSLCPIKSKGRSFGAARNPGWLKLALARRMSRAANRGTHTRAATSARDLPFEAGPARQQQSLLALAIHRTISITRQIIRAKANPAGSAASSPAPLSASTSPLPRDSRRSALPARSTRETPLVACSADNRGSLHCFQLIAAQRRDVRRHVGAQHVAPQLATRRPR